MQVIEQHYQTVRLGFIEGQERRAETVRDDLQQRQGYYSLVENQRQRVLQTIWQAVYDTTAEALYPPLLELRDTAQLKLGRAAEEAHQYLSEELSKKGEEVVEFRLNLQNREVSSPDQVEALVEQLRHRLLAQLQGKSQIRLRLLP
jgi:TRAP-type C4-dicarboxylate transport system substrate-binding protein